MDNQHKRITGYRDLTQHEIDLMNQVKEKAEECSALIEELRKAGMMNDAGYVKAPLIDARWLAIGTTDLQTGFMALIRAIARPTTF